MGCYDVTSCYGQHHTPLDSTPRQHRPPPIAPPCPWTAPSRQHPPPWTAPIPQTAPPHPQIAPPHWTALPHLMDSTMSPGQHPPYQTGPLLLNSTTTLDNKTPFPSRSTSGRYASYWNAFWSCQSLLQISLANKATAAIHGTSGYNYTAGVPYKVLCKWYLTHTKLTSTTRNSTKTFLQFIFSFNKKLVELIDTFKHTIHNNWSIEILHCRPIFRRFYRLGKSCSWNKIYILCWTQGQR